MSITVAPRVGPVFRVNRNTYWKIRCTPTPEGFGIIVERRMVTPKAKRNKLWKVTFKEDGQ